MHNEHPNEHKDQAYYTSYTLALGAEELFNIKQKQVSTVNCAI